MQTAGYDLGIFDQAVRAYAGLSAPIVPIKGPGFNLLGDHFHPILVVLVPLYWLWPSAKALLLAQAVLISISVVPVCRLAVARLGVRHGAAVTVAYGLSWGIQGAIAFDFHEIAFGVPLLAFALTALAGERWRQGSAWALPLLLVKEDMGLTVAAVGAYLILKRQRRLGTALIAGGAATAAFVILVLIPALNPRGVYRYWDALDGARGEGLTHLAAALPATLVQPSGKLVLLLAVGGVTGFAALRSPLVLIAAPTLLVRLASSRPLYWSTGPVHYNAILMPIVFVGLVQAVPLLEASPRRRVRRYARVTVPAAPVVCLVLLPFFPFRSLLDPRFYQAGSHATAARHILRLIPDGATVAAANYLAPQLTDRCTVVLFPNVYETAVDWVVVDTTRLEGVPLPPAEQQAAFRALPAQGFREVDHRDGIAVFRRGW
ncbi:MAG: rane protein [Streptosporangiaceae bacterium]|nr:rane protein [Streptosporangiaceae bacterium]